MLLVFVRVISMYRDRALGCVEGLGVWSGHVSAHASRRRKDPMGSGQLSHRSWGVTYYFGELLARR